MYASRNGAKTSHLPMVDNSWSPQEELEMNGDDGQEQWWEVEIETLKSSLKALNVQLFQERKQWLAEKTELEKAAQAGPQSDRQRWHSDSGGGLMRSKGLERSPALERSGMFDRPSGSALDGTASVGSDCSVSSMGQVQALQAQLASAYQERDAARQEAARLKAETQRWNMERAALQREVDVLRSRGGGDDGGASDEALAQLEEEKAALQSELDLIKQSLKNNVLVPRAHMAQLSGGSGSNPASPMPGGPTGKPPLPVTPPLGGRSSSQLSLSAASPDANSTATIQRLNAEITRLQADLYILKDECVPVPKAEYGKLRGVHSEKAGVEEELKQLRQELIDVQRLNRMLQDELDLIKEEHCAITLQEYDELRRAAAEKTALELKLEAQAKFYVQVPKEELESLQAARRQLAGVETKLAAMHAVAAVNADDMSRALQAAVDDAAELRMKLMEAESRLSDLQRDVQAGEGRSRIIAELQEKLRVSEAAVQSVQLEKSRLQIRMGGLEDELTTNKKHLREAQEESARLSRELGTSRDTISGLKQEVSTLSRERGELEAKVSELRGDREALTAELVDAKLELARLREMEVLYKKNVLVTKKQLYGLPSQDQ